MIDAAKGLTLLCCECKGEIEESAAFAFSGAFACESCLRDYYRDSPRNLELELQRRRREAVSMLKHHRPKLEKQAARKATVDKKIALIAEELEDLVLRCSQCGGKISPSTAFAFGGGVACEKCVRNYYRNRPGEIELELQSRRKEAILWAKRNRKTLEKRAAKRAG